VEVLYILLSIYLSTWIMIVYRTFSYIEHILEDRNEQLLTKLKTIHLIVYGLGTICIVPLIWQIAFFEGVRKTWVVAYCDAVTKEQK
jgi:hypothetical protein